MAPLSCFKLKKRFLYPSTLINTTKRSPAEIRGDGRHCRSDPTVRCKREMGSITSSALLRSLPLHGITASGCSTRQTDTTFCNTHSCPQPSDCVPRNKSEFNLFTAFGLGLTLQQQLFRLIPTERILSFTEETLGTQTKYYQSVLREKPP